MKIDDITKKASALAAGLLISAIGTKALLDTGEKLGRQVSRSLREKNRDHVAGRSLVARLKGRGGKRALTGMEQLDSLVGLESLKEDVRALVDLVKMQRERQARGLKSVPVSLHLVFTGNPGTGKTTVARILAQIYKEIGVLSKGQLVEVDRSGLVAGYVGQTALKTQEKINEAIGGILFIDEAYTLAKEGSDFGQEAIETILKAMEDNRDNFIVIVAGYPERMKRFINSNPGLKSRFNKYFDFPDYQVDELEQIFYVMCRRYEYRLSDGARAKVREHLEKACDVRGRDFANARDVRNFFEKIVGNHASRIMGMENVSETELVMIREEDVEV